MLAGTGLAAWVHRQGWKGSPYTGGHRKVTRLLHPSFWGPSTVVTSAAGPEKWRCPFRSSQSWRFECDCALTPTALYSDYLWKSVQFMTTRNSHDHDPWPLHLKLVPWLTALLRGILYHFLISCMKVPQKTLWTGKKDAIFICHLPYSSANSSTF